MLLEQLGEVGVEVFGFQKVSFYGGLELEFGGFFQLTDELTGFLGVSGDIRPLLPNQLSIHLVHSKLALTLLETCSIKEHLLVGCPGVQALGSAFLVALLAHLYLFHQVGPGVDYRHDFLTEVYD